jgi:capsular exopolysaccharide synthesis family protein
MTQLNISRSNLSFQTEESIKMLRTSIQFSRVDVNSITITSTRENEGKSFIAMELARAFADLGKKTLLVDCDIRNSVFAKKLGISDRTPGLSDFLVGNAALKDILCATRIPNLSVILSGSYAPNPAELLNSARFCNLCEALNEKLDFVIYDTPPLTAVTDAVIVAQNTDGAVMVVSEGETDRRELIHCASVLENANVHIIGTVLNKAGSHNGKYGKYGKYGYGEYGYGKR